MINLTSAANIPQLKISFSYKETDTIKPLLQSRSLEEIKESAGPVDHSVKNRSADPDLHNVSESTMWRRDHGDSSRSLSCPFTHQELPANNINLPRASSLPNMKPQSSFKATSLLKMKPKRGYEEFTPDLIYKEDDVTYMFRCSSPGLYWCRQTGLVFDMKGEGDVSYRIVPWDTRLLSQHGKKPAGPLFDISCQQQSVAQLHLPHCEIRSHCEILSVAHIHDEGIEFIRPERITETHVVINITGYSGFGIIIHGNSHRSFQALVLLFHEVPLESESDHVINVLVLPKNVVFRNVLVFRKELDKEEIFIEMPPHCKLQPKKHYTLSTSPGEDSVQVQPPKAKFDAGSYNNYLTTFRVVYKKTIKEIKLSLRQNNSSSVWESVVCYSAVENKKSFRLIQPDFNSKQQLEVIRRSFIEGISEPVLKSLLDKLLEKRVLNNFEKEYVESEKTKMDKARVLVDIVKKKGDAASSEMISFLCELDPFFSQHLGLI
ncbi:caspase recruitment domain-containing protein 8-like [Cyprinodon tularosa]|uniref:caspase recruitment domain-containing protein 8-like n=1 Tax=Cyprinodon tularosa TaxID=77115 RepID=UPI0018E20554|nr:caspase recruitment domain-containing protein 8-like [Cyprinodon tularosa]